MSSEGAGPDHRLIIVGSGPAGYTAALYAGRAGLQPYVLEGSVASGGALMNTTDVENFPGFPTGVLGPNLMEQMRVQADRFGAVLVRDDALSCDLTGAVKVVRDGAGQEHRAPAVIIAAGSAYRTLGLPREQELSGHGVSWCATCDGYFFRDKDVAVVGGGDSAMEEATFLARFARTVTVIHRRPTLRASKIMRERALAEERIRFRWNSEVVGLLGDGRLSGVRLRERGTGAELVLELDGLFVAIGHQPRTELVAGQLALDPAGYIEVVGRTSQTSAAGVFACGDVVDHSYRQAVTAAGSGCAAALDADRYLATLEPSAVPVLAGHPVEERPGEELWSQPR